MGAIVLKSVWSDPWLELPLSTLKVNWRRLFKIWGKEHYLLWLFALLSMPSSQWMEHQCQSLYGLTYMWSLHQTQVPANKKPLPGGKILRSDQWQNTSWKKHFSVGMCDLITSLLNLSIVCDRTQATLTKPLILFFDVLVFWDTLDLACEVTGFISCSTENERKIFLLPSFNKISCASVLSADWQSYRKSENKLL